jgi:hypothetical protein
LQLLMKYMVLDYVCLYKGYKTHQLHQLSSSVCSVTVQQFDASVAVHSVKAKCSVRVGTRLLQSLKSKYQTHQQVVLLLPQTRLRRPSQGYITIIPAWEEMPMHRTVWSLKNSKDYTSLNLQLVAKILSLFLSSEGESWEELTMP